MGVRTFSATLAPDAALTRLDRLVADLWPELSRKLARKVIEAGGCFVDGARCHVPATQPRPGSRVRVCVDPDRPFVRFTLDPARVLFEDPHLLVVDKPSGVPVNLSATGQEGSLQRGVEDYLASHGLPGRPAVLHRLDTGTSGVVLFGKTPEAERRVYALFRERKVLKTYLAVVSPPPLNPAGTVRTLIARRLDRLNQYAVRRERGKEALTRYRTLHADPGAGWALLAVSPETGRPHQIRVHLAWIGCPIAGDRLYGGREDAPFFGLHAFRVSLPHPRTGDPLVVRALPPANWGAPPAGAARGPLPAVTEAFLRSGGAW
ncbi:MAG: RluA family pseudouridine synthase [Acidobacteria bacterium]|nr:RluA family pseudouridine synthase [Acidobacteriota bacterium]